MSALDRNLAGAALAVALISTLAVCDDDDNPLGPEFDRAVDPQLVANAREV